IKSLSDIKYIPPTTKADLRDNYPFGMFAVPMSDIVRIHASSGTTGKPTVVGYTKKDLDMWSDCVARIAVAAGATKEDIVQISFGYGMFTGALGLHCGLEKIGCAVVPNSSGNTEKALMFMRDFKTTALVATPSYALYMAETAKKLEYPMSDYHLRLGLFGSEGCTPEMRTQIEKGWGLFATDNYGMSELIGPGVSGECTERCGLHINEDHFLVEVVDPETLEPVDEGEDGELIVTPLSKEAFPLLRYRTRDISNVIYEPCKCGRTFARMEKIKGRSDDMLKIRGVNVFPSQIESVLVGMKNVSPHYQLIVRREGFADTLEVQVELSDNSLLESFGMIQDLQNSIKHNLHTVLGIQCKVSIVEPMTIERFVGKAKRVIDLRHEKD
ncbi:MAG TPA: phenylacetate--CoA ligase, partial [Ruminococcaceae bacterium]|nr:phenylacetate--CoA ligase [Oscillospiraceae bacterium]